MNRFNKVTGYLFAAILMAICSQNLRAEILRDEDDMPIAYLRGEVTGWSIDDNYKFTRQGNDYYLVITEDNPIYGNFKIGDSEWRFVDLGAYENNPKYDVKGSIYYSPLFGGFNFTTSEGITDAVISFNLLDIYNNVGFIKFMINGVEPDLTVKPEPEPEPEPEPSPQPDPGTMELISGTLPVMYINVYTDASHTVLDNEVINYNLEHKDYFKQAEYWLETNGCTWLEELGAKNVGSKDEPLPLQIKARGNWTRIGFSKKPFKIKLDKKQNLLGLTPEKSKHYALLAHSDDTYGFLRNFTNFNLGKRIGLPWTPGMQPVELVINGDYRGMYFLTESVRVGDGRIPIEELEDNATDPKLVTGGYVVELDNYYEPENQIQMDEMSCASGWHNIDVLRITFDTPEVYSDIQRRFVTDQFSAMNRAIGYNSDETWSYLDLDDAARYYLVEEICGHTESYHGSTYLYRDRGENQKWHFSPLWDAGNAFQALDWTFFYDCDPFGNTWIPSMRENNEFNKKVMETWLWFMQNKYSGLEQDLDVFASHIKAGAQADHARWKNVTPPSGGQPVADNRDMDSKLSQVKAYLESRINWLTYVFGDYTYGVFAEPERDTTEAAPLPDYVDVPDKEEPGDDDDNSGIKDVTNIGDSNDVIEFYNLQGVKVQHPSPGQPYILRQGKISRKVIFK